ncbi:PEP-CTERM sorting domain-containing protein [Planctomycetota bacterium]|nr:PEP-CTERM sorting domain-containing protein [Planctomycetota bacterium]
MRKAFSTLALLTAAATITSTASAAVLFEEGFDSAADANLINVVTGEVETMFVDYSNFNVAHPTEAGTSENFKLGVAASGKGTTGMLVRANMTGGATSGLQFYAANAAGEGINFTGTYKMSWDSYASIPTGTASSTEFLQWGVGRQDTANHNGYGTDSDTWDGSWGVSSGDGYTLAGGDAHRFAINGSLIAKQATEGDASQAAFPGGENGYPEAGMYQNKWTHWEVSVEGEVGYQQITLSANGVKIFDSFDTGSANGFAYLGYEDYWSSVNSTPMGQWMIFDNFVITDGAAIPEPASLALLGLGGLAMLRRRK